MRGLLLLAACEDVTSVTWYAFPDTLELYSLASPVPNTPNAYDFISSELWLVEKPDATGNWDVAIGSAADGFTLMPPGSLGISSYAGVWTMEGASFDDLTTAPSDTSAYVPDEPVPLTLGDAYVIRTRQIAGSDGSACAYYAKVELLEVDLTSYRVALLFDVNPRCNDRGLVPDA